MAPKVSKSALVQRFCAVTNAATDEAQAYLRSCSYRLEEAIDAFLNDRSGGPSAARLSASQEKEARALLNALYEDYRDADEDLISSEGALSMLQNLGIDPASVAVLPLSYYLDSPALGQFARAAYVDGWLRLGVGAGASTKDEVLAQQRAAVSSVMESFAADGPVVPPYASRGAPLLKKGLYTTVYEYTFVFARSEGQKNLGVSTCPPANAALELALTFWDLLLPHAPVFDADGQRAARGEPSFSPTQFDLWKRFLTEASGLRVISKDTWNQFLEFMHEIDPDFAKHDFEAAWPSVIDEFVDWVHSQRT